MWRNGFELDELADSTATYNINVLFQFLKWAYNNDEFPTPVLDKLSKGDFGAIARSEINTSKYETIYSPPPSTLDMVAVQQAIAAHGGTHVERDMLMFRWAKEVGFRNADIIEQSATTFFTWGQILELEQEAKPAILKVKGKGEKVRKTHPPVSLLKDTRSYLDSLPADEVKSIDRIFYSQDRLPLSQQYVSHRFAYYFKIAGLDSHLHRARAYYLYQLILNKIQELSKNGELNDFSAQTVLQFALNAAGHGDIEVLKYYVDLGLLSLHSKAVKII